MVMSTFDCDDGLALFEVALREAELLELVAEIPALRIDGGEGAGATI